MIGTNSTTTRTLDIERALRGRLQITVTGLLNDSAIHRHALIEDAIAKIQANSATALVERYLGIKNYASFGDQREDHPYNYGPKHGSIVFRIARTYAALSDKRPLDSDAIYLLEAVRDFGTVDLPELEQLAKFNRVGNLCDLLDAYGVLNKLSTVVTDVLSQPIVEETAVRS